MAQFVVWNRNSAECPVAIFFLITVFLAVLPLIKQKMCSLYFCALYVLTEFIILMPVHMPNYYVHVAATLKAEFPGHFE